MQTVDILVLTQYGGSIVGPFAKLLGYVMEFLYNAFSSIGIENIGLCIITFTFLIRLILLPLTVKQQKFSRMSAVMTPELNKIRDKYQNKKDNESMMRMDEETKAVYAKYGVSRSGSCLQMLIQMPILFGLYRVIWSIPAYVPKVYDIYKGAAEMLVKGGFIQVTKNAASLVTEGATAAEANLTNLNYTIDALSNGQIKWSAAIDAVANAGQNTDVLTAAMDRASQINGFFGINLGQSPMELMGFALLIPVLAGLTQWISAKLMMSNTNNNNNNANDPTAGTMKMMNTMMPMMSAVMCFMFSCGLGIYWITGSVFQILSQLAINYYFNKVGIDAIVKKNVEKMNKKREKQGLPPHKITDTAASVSSNRTRQNNTQTQTKKPENRSQNQKQNQSQNTARTTAKPGSLAEKARLVQTYNETHKK